MSSRHARRPHRAGGFTQPPPRTDRPETPVRHDADRPYDSLPAHDTARSYDDVPPPPALGEQLHPGGAAVGNHQPPAGGYLEPEIGFPACRDALAAVRALWAGDAQGVHAVLANCEAPRHVAWFLTIFSVQVCRRGGLDDAGLDVLLGELRHLVADFLLDQRRPGSPKEVA